MKTITETMVRKVIRPRDPAGHKGTFGRVLIIGGNDQFGGAAIMSASAAVYSGAGLVSVATAAVNRSALHARLPEAMIIPYDDARLTSQINAADVIVIGPGLGLDDTAKQVLTTTFAAIKPAQTLIIDGSAIDLIAADKLAAPQANLIWTPHQKEWERLSGIKIKDQTPTANQQAATKLLGTVIVKSHRTEIFSPTASYENPVGSAAMATGGSGDTLTGILAGFMAQFGYNDLSILAAVYTHSAIADSLATTNYVVLPSMVIQALPHFMCRMATTKQTNTESL